MCKKFIIFFGFCVFVFCSIFYGSSVYALDDKSLTFDSTNTSDGVLTYLCGVEQTGSCDGYSYLLIEPSDDLRSGPSSSSVNFRISFSSVLSRSYTDYYVGYSSSSFIPYPDYIVLNSSISAISVRNFVYRGSLKLTLTNNLPSNCPICEECQQCPAIPDNPYDDKLDNIVKAIYVCAATILVIYFFYCIYRMIIKGGKL